MSLTLLTKLRVPLLLIVVLTLLSPNVVGQGPKVYEPLVRTAEFNEAMRLKRSFYSDRALGKFSKIVTENPGTTLAAESMFQIALIHFQAFNDEAGGLAVYQDVITRFPGSRFEVRARRYTLDHTIGWRRQPQEWLQGQNEIVGSYGAPTIAEITRSGVHDSLIERVRALPVEIQVGIMSIYTHCEVLFAFEMGRYDEAIALGIFNRKTFLADVFSDYSPLASQFLRYAQVAKYLGPEEWDSAPTMDPVIERRGPKTGHKTGNRRPKISVEITAGDYLQPQVDFAKLEFSMSGLDLKPYARVDSQIDRKPGKGKVYERLRLTARPPQPLADGTYEVRVVAPVHGYRGDGPGRAATTWHFTVAHGGPHHDDDGEDCR